MILLDTDHISVLSDRRHALKDRLEARLSMAGEVVAMTIVTVEEHFRGWAAQIHRIRDPYRQIIPYLRLAKFIDFLRTWNVVDWNEPAADIFSELRSSRLRIGTQDLKIASIALASDALLLLT